MKFSNEVCAAAVNGVFCDADIVEGAEREKDHVHVKAADVEYLENGGLRCEGRYFELAMGFDLPRDVVRVAKENDSPLRSFGLGRKLLYQISIISVAMQALTN